MKLFILNQASDILDKVINSANSEAQSFVSDLIGGNKIDWSKGFYKPIKITAPVTNPFGARERGGKIHQGIDFGLPVGTPIYSVRAGTVIKCGHKSGSYNGGTGSEGNFVVIDHGSGIRSHYYHLSMVGVKEGQTVTQSTVIGKSGNTGNSTGPHLHLEFQINRVPQKVTISDLR